MTSFQPVPTAVQRRIGLLDRVSGGADLFNTGVCCVLGPRVEAEAVIDAVRSACSRHEVLRTAFTFDGDEVHTGAAQPMDIQLVRGASVDFDDPDDRRELADLAIAERARPFRFDSTPLVRALVRPLSGHCTLLALTLHRLVADANSMSALLEDIVSRVAGAPQPSTAAQSYAQFAARDEARARADLEYWDGYLTDLPVERIGDLPAVDDDPQPAKQERTLGAGALAAAHAAATAQRVSLVARCTGVFAHAVLRASAAPEVVLGLSHDARMGRYVVGPIAEVMLVRAARADLDPLVTAVARDIRAGIRHQHASFADVVQLLYDRGLAADDIAPLTTEVAVRPSGRAHQSAVPLRMFRPAPADPADEAAPLVRPGQLHLQLLDVVAGRDVADDQVGEGATLGAVYDGNAYSAELVRAVLDRVVEDFAAPGSDGARDR